MPPDEQLNVLLGVIEGIEQNALLATLKPQYEAWQRCGTAYFEQAAADDKTSDLNALLGAEKGGRNPQMATRLLAMAEQHGQFLAAVGTLHLFSEQGLLALLRQQGYTVTDLSARPAPL